MNKTLLLAFLIFLRVRIYHITHVITLIEKSSLEKRDSETEVEKTLNHIDVRSFMASQMAILARTRSLIAILHSNSSVNTFAKTITTFNPLSQEPQLAEEPTPSPLPPNPASGSPLYNENWRSPLPASTSQSSIISPGRTLLSRSHQTYDIDSLLNVFADLTAFMKWGEIKQLFEHWVKSLDKFGKPNKPNVNLYNHYLRANLMLNASVEELLDLLVKMEDFGVTPNTASFNLVLKAMCGAQETLAAEKLLERLVDESFFCFFLLRVELTTRILL